MARVEYNEDGSLKAVVLSRRNLITGLVKLDGHPEAGARTIMVPIQYGTVAIQFEEDGEHYFHPEREAHRAGPMHPDTERQMAQPDPLSPEDRIALDTELSDILTSDDDGLN